MATTGWFCAALSLLAFPMALGGQSAPDWTNLRRFFRQQVSDAGIVGASLVIVRDGKVEAEEYAGSRDIATKRPVDRDTIYHWASITKTFTGIAIMQLRDRGLLTLDDPGVADLLAKEAAQVGPVRRGLAGERHRQREQGKDRAEPSGFRHRAIVGDRPESEPRVLAKGSPERELHGTTCQFTRRACTWW